MRAYHLLTEKCGPKLTNLNSKPRTLISDPTSNTARSRCWVLAWIFLTRCLSKGPEKTLEAALSSHSLLHHRTNLSSLCFAKQWGPWWEMIDSQPLISGCSDGQRLDTLQHHTLLTILSFLNCTLVPPAVRGCLCFQGLFFPNQNCLTP